MYESYWQLEARPFDHSFDMRFYYPSEAHQGALLKLRYAIDNRHGAALLAGAPGLGKTLLTELLLARLPEHFAPRVHLVFPQMPLDQLLSYLADELTGQTSAQPGTIGQSVRRIQNTLTENATAGRHAVVVIDEAHLLADSGSLETIRLLLNFQIAAKPAMTLLLAAQPALLPALERMPSLEERLSVKSLLRPLTLEETVSYVNHRLTAAGAGKTIFDPEALQALHQLSRGVPQRINRLADLALLIGYAEEQSTLGAAQIEAVSDELVAVAPE